MILLVSVMAAMGLLLLYGGLTAKPDADGKVRRMLLFRFDGGGGRIATVSIGSGLLAFLVIAGLTGLAVAALVAAVVSALLVISRMRGRTARRRARMSDEWPDLLASLISAVRAGISLPEACAELAGKANVAAGPVFEGFAATYRATGSFTAGLKRLRTDADDPIADRIVVCLQAAHEVGGSDLVPVLQALADFVHQDLRVRKEIEARWSWNVTAARVAAAAPPIVLLLMATRPEGSAAFGTSAGSAVIVAGALTTALGYWLMLRIARLPSDARLR